MRHRAPSQYHARPAPAQRPGAIICQQRHRLEIIQHVVRKVQGRAVHDVRVPMTDTHCVAVGRCTCDPPDANAAAPT
jgi:hypothetical protein